LSPITIAEYYRQRWQIETLFKRLKKNYPLKYFLGDSENAIKVQIWSVLIADLLLKVINKKAGSRMSFSNLASMIRLHLMTYLKLEAFLQAPEKELIKKIKGIVPDNHSPTLF
jgi:IS4 transposase